MIKKREDKSKSSLKLFIETDPGKCTLPVKVEQSRLTQHNPGNVLYLIIERILMHYHDI